MIQIHLRGNYAPACPMHRVASLATLTALAATASAPAQWTQWGGPHQDWIAPAAALADSWPESGPPRLWKRDLGEGYSAILADQGKLYTLYRAGGQEIAVCLKADTGETLWGHKDAVGPKPGHIEQFGSGPRATPVLANGRLFTAGVAGRLTCLDAQTGKSLWSKDLWDDNQATRLEHGYSSSAVACEDAVIVLVGGPGHAIVALNQADGKVLWQRHDFRNSYSSAKIIKLDGRDHLVAFMADEIVGLDPGTGELLWSYKIGNQFKQNVCLPLWGDDNILFFSTSEGGSRGLKLSRQGDRVTTEELWSTRKIQFYHVTAVRVGDWIYGSTGSGTCFMSALNAKTGEVAWRERGFGKATVIYADGKLIILDEDGQLALASPTPQGLNLRSKAPVLDRVSWTAPTLVGRTLYLRDQKSIMALDLGKSTG